MLEGPIVRLLDAHVYIFRAYDSMPSLSAPDGTPMGAVLLFDRLGWGAAIRERIPRWRKDA